MKKPCRYCKKEFNANYVKNHQKRCKIRPSPSNLKSRLKITDPKLKDILGPDTSEFEKEITKSITEKIQKDPNAFLKVLEEKGYFNENKS